MAGSKRKPQDNFNKCFVFGRNGAANAFSVMGSQAIIYPYVHIDIFIANSCRYVRMDIHMYVCAYMYVVTL